MPFILYKAPHCLRCDIVKQFLENKGLAYEAFQLDTDKETVNTFYRVNRSRLYRNAEGAEFPMFHDTDNDIILQGSGMVLAYLLAGHGLDAAVTRSDLLHGWISGLYASHVPDGEEEHFLELVRLLAKGGLEVSIQADGRKPELLQRILQENLAAKVTINIPGPAALYPHAVGGPAPTAEELKQSIALARSHKNHVVRLWLIPLRTEADAPRWLTPAEAGEAARMVTEACGEMTMPFGIQISQERIEGLETLEEGLLLPYRSKVRNYLPKAEILKADA